MYSRVRAAGGGHLAALHGLLLLLGLAVLFRLLLADPFTQLRRTSLPVTAGGKAGLAPLTQGSAMDGFGAWSPSGRELVFMRDGQILLADGEGKRVRAVTSEPSAWDAAPAWRPDGKALAFVRLSTRDERSQVMALPLENGQAGQPRELAHEAGSIGYLAWSPGGDALYYTTAERIMRIAAATGRRTEVYRAPRGWELLSGGIAVSRDGRSLIFGGGPRLERGVEYDLYRIPVTGGEPRRLTTQGGIMPALHPNGQLVAYRNPRTETGIYLLNLATAAVERVLPDEPRVMFFHPQFDPAGRRMLVSRLQLTTPPAQGRGGFTSHLYVLRLEGR